MQRFASGKVQQNRCKYSSLHLASCKKSGVYLARGAIIQVNTFARGANIQVCTFTRGANAKVVTVKVQAITANIQVAIVKP